jgi:hypothetical protein
VMAVPAGRVTGFLPNQLDALCGALVSELSSDGDGLVEQPIEMAACVRADGAVAFFGGAMRIEKISAVEHEGFRAVLRGCFGHGDCLRRGRCDFLFASR